MSLGHGMSLWPNLRLAKIVQVSGIQDRFLPLTATIFIYTLSFWLLDFSFWIFSRWFTWPGSSNPKGILQSTKRWCLSGTSYRQEASFNCLGHLHWPSCLQKIAAANSFYVSLRTALVASKFSPHSF